MNESGLISKLGGKKEGEGVTRSGKRNALNENDGAETEPCKNKSAFVLALLLLLLNRLFGNKRGFFKWGTPNYGGPIFFPLLFPFAAGARVRWAEPNPGLFGTRIGGLRRSVLGSDCDCERGREHVRDVITGGDEGRDELCL